MFPSAVGAAGLEPDAAWLTVRWQTVRWDSHAFYTDPARPRNPYDDPMCRHSHGQPFGNGDGLFFYPPAARLAPPVTSIRMEMLRDGLEDYEYFVMLKARDPTSPLLRVPADVSASLTEFTRSPLPLAVHRRRLAEAIVQHGESARTPSVTPPSAAEEPDDKAPRAGSTTPRRDPLRRGDP